MDYCWLIDIQVYSKWSPLSLWLSLINTTMTAEALLLQGFRLKSDLLAQKLSTAMMNPSYTNGKYDTDERITILSHTEENNNVRRDHA